jgi:hypothetical protein
MSRLRFPIFAVIAALLPVAAVSAGGAARADAPAPGDPCTVLHATAQDVNDRTMWCNRTMTGDNDLVWQYGGPA